MKLSEVDKLVKSGYTKTSKLLYEEPKIKKQNYYGFDHSKINENFEGGLTYVNDFTVKGTTDWVAVAVYKCTKPNRVKGHKKYVLLMTNFGGGGIISGMDYSQIRKYRYHKAVHCLNCNTILYSVNRHNFHKCGCKNEAMVDGGNDYMRYGAKDFSKIRVVKLDLLTDKIVK